MQGVRVVLFLQELQQLKEQRFRDRGRHLDVTLHGSKIVQMALRNQIVARSSCSRISQVYKYCSTGLRDEQHEKCELPKTEPGWQSLKPLTC